MKSDSDRRSSRDRFVGTANGIGGAINGSSVEYRAPIAPTSRIVSPRASLAAAIGLKLNLRATRKTNFFVRMIQAVRG
jgi:hypothetical protein